MGGGRSHLAPGQVLLLRECVDHAEARAAAAARLCGVLLQAVHRARRPAWLRTDRRAVRCRHQLWRAQAGLRTLQRDLCQAWHDAAAADVQLLHPLRRRQRAGDGAAPAPNPLLQGVRHPRLPGRPPNRAAELSVLHRNGGTASQGEARGPDRDFCLAGSRPAGAADAGVAYAVDFKGYTGGSVLEWLGRKKFVAKQDADNKSKIVLSIHDEALVLEAKQRALGLLLNETDVPGPGRI